MPRHRCCGGACWAAVVRDLPSPTVPLLQAGRFRLCLWACTLHMMPLELLWGGSQCVVHPRGARLRTPPFGPPCAACPSRRRRSACHPGSVANQMACCPCVSDATREGSMHVGRGLEAGMGSREAGQQRRAQCPVRGEPTPLSNAAQLPRALASSYLVAGAPPTFVPSMRKGG